MPTDQEKARQDRQEGLNGLLSLKNMRSSDQTLNELVSSINFYGLHVARISRDDEITMTDHDSREYATVFSELQTGWKGLHKTFVQGEPEYTNEKDWKIHQNLRKHVTQRVCIYASISEDEGGTQLMWTKFDKVRLEFFFALLKMQFYRLRNLACFNSTTDLDLFKSDIDGLGYEELKRVEQFTKNDTSNDEMRRIVIEAIKNNKSGGGHKYATERKFDLVAGAKYREGDTIGRGAMTNGQAHDYSGTFTWKGAGEVNLGNDYQ
ncbi:hypothetical protein BS50DRAFT_593170 [Corynespora cassiicola Philippines]|uniref:Uncharacterized protein n=1 Tax=Corynespora cassiicola Philippines TaxID=1448308 RepID=A0A2T2N7P0_CORCC|nr:hypothetical protein BS50DRAFT_593170 [Corynespora cassiicola Philippines]